MYSADDTRQLHGATNTARSSTRMLFKEAYSAVLQSATLDLALGWQDNAIVLHRPKHPERVLLHFSIDRFDIGTMTADAAAQRLALHTPKGMTPVNEYSATQAWRSLRDYVLSMETRIGTTRDDTAAISRRNGTVRVSGIHETFGKIVKDGVLVLPEDFVQYHTDDAATPATTSVLNNHSNLLFFPLMHYRHSLHLQ